MERINKEEEKKMTKENEKGMTKEEMKHLVGGNQIVSGNQTAIYKDTQESIQNRTEK